MTPAPWRVGRKLGRTLYERKYTDQPSDDDRFLGIMDTREDAQRVVDAVNAMGKAVRPLPAPDSHAIPESARCTSCEHYMEFHQLDGCWHAVAVGRQDGPMGCPCGVHVDREASDA